jgi:putative resolvase
LLDDCFEGNVTTILVAHQDRYVRFGYDWFASILGKRGVEILVVKDDSLSPQQKIIDNSRSIVHVFNCRIYGLRKYKKEIEEDESFEESL